MQQAHDDARSAGLLEEEGAHTLRRGGEGIRGAGVFSRSGSVNYKGGGEKMRRCHAASLLLMPSLPSRHTVKPDYAALPLANFFVPRFLPSSARPHFFAETLTRREGGGGGYFNFRKTKRFPHPKPAGSANKAPSFSYLPGLLPPAQLQLNIPNNPSSPPDLACGFFWGVWDLGKRITQKKRGEKKKRK